MPNITRIPAPRVPLIDERTGLMTREWFRYFQNLYTQTGADGSTASIQDLELQAGASNADSISELQKQLQDLLISMPPLNLGASAGTSTTYSVFTSTTNGLTPASGGGTINYLRADGTWAVPPGTATTSFANPTAKVGPTAVNGTATTAMRSDAAPALDLTANYTVTGQWAFSNAGLGSSIAIYANATNWQGTVGYVGSAEFAITTVSFSGAPSMGLYVAGNRYFRITSGAVDVLLGATLNVNGTSVRDGAILTSGTVASARLPGFGAAANGIVPASGGGTTNFLRADGTWAVPPGIGGAYGTFYDTTTQTAAATGTAYGITFNTTDLTSDVYIGTTTSRIYVNKTGIYNFQFSAQLDKTSANAKSVWIWARINGTNVANSATKVTIGGNSSAHVAAWNFVYSMTLGDYFELMWSTDDTDCQIVAAAASSPYPAIPSVIMTVTDNISR